MIRGALRALERVLRRDRHLTLVLVVGLGCGVGMWGLSSATWRQLVADPLGGRVGLYTVSLERETRIKELIPEDRQRFGTIIETQVSLGDATALAAGEPGAFLTTTATVAVRPDHGPAREIAVRFGPPRIFSSFGLRFRQGGPWAGGQGAVLDEETSQILFGGPNSVGRTVSIGRHAFQVTGVLGPEEARRQYDISRPKLEGVFLPFEAFRELRLWPDGFKPAADLAGIFEAPLSREDSVVRLWIELADPGAVAAFEQKLQAWVGRERTSPRAMPLVGARLVPYAEWQEAASSTEPLLKIFSYIGILILVGCALNLVRLLIVRFGARAGELAIRRALGASRATIFAGHLLEAAFVGLLAGLLGMVLTALAIPAFNRLIDTLPMRYYVDGAALLGPLAAGPVAAVLAALYPAFRSSRLRPASYLGRR